MSPREMMSEEDLDWIKLAQNRVQWKNFVKTVMKLRSYIKVRNLLIT
jgi:hypothetical protein